MNTNPDHAFSFEKTKFLNRLFGTKVVPSYCYSRVYRPGTHLGRHKDRPALNISKCPSLWQKSGKIVDKDGKDIEIILQPGDAIICDALWNTGENHFLEVMMIFMFRHFNIMSF